MALRINSNIASITAQRYLANHQQKMDDAYKALASGSRLNLPQSTAADYAISENIRAQVAGLNQAQRNTEMARSIVQTAEGALNQQNNILIRLRELAVSAASDTLSDNDRKYSNQEFTQLLSEFDRIAKSTRFGSRHLLNGSMKDFTFQVGPNSGKDNQIHFKLDADTTASSLGIDGEDVLDKGDARDAMSSIDDALQQIASVRAKLGAVQSRFNYAIDNLATQNENMQAAHSVIADSDVATESTRLTQQQILNDAAVSVLAQANISPKAALKLID